MKFTAGLSLKAAQGPRWSFWCVPVSILDVLEDFKGSRCAYLSVRASVKVTYKECTVPWTLLRLLHAYDVVFGAHFG